MVFGVSFNKLDLRVILPIFRKCIALIRGVELKKYILYNSKFMIIFLFLLIGDANGVIE